MTTATTETSAHPMAKSRRTTSSDETKARILTATIETLKDDGLLGLTARGIARKGGFNQALIYYHYGSITEAVLAGIGRMSEDRIERYQGRLEGMRTLTEIAEVAAALHHEDVEAGNMTVLTQVLAASAADPELRAGLFERFAPWNQLVEEAVQRVLDGTPFAGVISVPDVAFAASSLFIGIELYAYLDPDPEREQSLFATITGIARLVDTLLQSGQLPAADPA
jgi:AcrR family transcriptional regulator